MNRAPRVFLLVSTVVVGAPFAARADCPPSAIPDSFYKGILDGNDGTGTDAGMVCCDIDRPVSVPGSVSGADLSIGLTHTWIGDLTIKLKSPQGTVSTVLSRPGYAEPADDGTGSGGDSSNWAGAVILFDGRSSGPSAETMGSTLDTFHAACTDDGICSYKPAHGSAAGSGLDVDFDGQSYVGTWQACIGDSALLESGNWTFVDLQVELDRRIPCVCGGKLRGGDRVRYAPVIAPASSARAAPEGPVPPPADASGEVMCGTTDSGGQVLVSWDGFSTGHDDQGLCDCPNQGGLPGTSGWYSSCSELIPDLPWLDDFESGDTSHWSSSVG